MSDFDFDELDKAVSGALGAPTQPGAASTPPTSTPAPAQPVVKPPAPRPEATPQPTSNPAARRTSSSGRFMDVVHPSSDMRPGGMMKNRPAPAQVAPNTTTRESESEPADQSEVSPPSQPEADTPAPLESPFLPGAKVTKRPLGGASVEADEQTPHTLDLDQSQPAHETMPDPIDFISSDKKADETIPETPPETPAVTIPEAEKAPVSLDSSSSDAAVAAAVPADKTPQLEAFAGLEEKEDTGGPTSITQQYKEQPRAEQTSGAIYDTDDYHKPLAHPEKKRSGAWVILWVLLLLAVGGGIGAALYFYVIPIL